jgi:hypothetical protein
MHTVLILCSLYYAGGAGGQGRYSSIVVEEAGTTARQVASFGVATNGSGAKLGEKEKGKSPWGKAETAGGMVAGETKTEEGDRIGYNGSIAKSPKYKHMATTFLNSSSRRYNPSPSPLHTHSTPHHTHPPPLPQPTPLNPPHNTPTTPTNSGNDYKKIFFESPVIPE